MSVVSRWLLFFSGFMDPICRHRLGGEKFSRDFSDLQSALCHERDISLHVRGDNLCGQYGLPSGTDADIEKEIPEGAAAAGAHDDEFLRPSSTSACRLSETSRRTLTGKSSSLFSSVRLWFLSGVALQGIADVLKLPGRGPRLYRFRYLSPRLRQGQDRKRWDPRDARHLPLLSGARLCRGRP